MELTVFKKCLIIMTTITTLASPITASAEQASFEDVNSSNSYGSYIQSLMQKGVIDGKEAGTFAPRDAITRAEFLKMIVVGFQLSLDRGHFHFFDLDGHWAAQYVQTAWNHGIIEGTADYRFTPDAFIRRDEAAVIIWRLLQQKGVKPSEQNFASAAPLEDWAREGVTQCLAKNLFGIPFSSGTMQDALSREQAAALIDSSMKISNQELYSDPKGQAPSETYENTQYGFSLKIPKSWEGKYDITDTAPTTAGHNIDFINKSTKYGILFTISVWSKKFWEENKEEINGQIRATKIGEKGDHVYVFHTPTDVQYDPADEKSMADYLSMFKDVEAIKGSFEKGY
ncbi:MULTISPECIES: S-layer homology domain-containing protein [unclassified Paenibacillus]|uniref:S-layer homology domain-containing protein n=1 Tax=unclassified Paenibacillus TaxID=185978 RepID=UPI00362DD897